MFKGCVFMFLRLFLNLEKRDFVFELLSKFTLNSTHKQFVIVEYFELIYSNVPVSFSFSGTTNF